MGQRDERVDAYLAQCADFARPILERCRAWVHEGCPEVTETIKWGVPAFEYRGLLANMAAFKQHATFGFWKHALVVGAEPERRAMGSFGRLERRADLPRKAEFMALLKRAMTLNEQGVTKVREKGRPKPELPVHPDFAAALKRSRAARATFDALAPSHRREYLEWIAEAKREATRARRIEQTIEWLAEGKKRNWKYESC